jgi:hypothetical protein
MIFSRRGIVMGTGLLGIAAAAIYGLAQPSPVDALSRRVVVLFPGVAAAAPAIRRLPWFGSLGKDRAGLARAIFGPSLSLLANGPPEAIQKFLADAVERDFRDGRIAFVDGWTLAQTEIRLIAFIALGER